MAIHHQDGPIRQRNTNLLMVNGCEHVETLITNLTNTATQALDTTTITAEARQVLSELAIIATKRNL